MTKLGLPDRIQACRPFDEVQDYDEYVGGKPRYDGVDRAGQAEVLRAHGADVVVSDLAELIPPP